MQVRTLNNESVIIAAYNRPNLRREHEHHPGNITRGGHRER